MGDVRINLDGHVAVVEIGRGPHNFFDKALIGELAAAFEQCDADPGIRCILLCSEGRNFCAGANFTDPERDAFDDLRGEHLYHHALRLFRCDTPVVAAVQGAATGGGLGLALVADFRVASAESRFTANFNRLGFHPGFGLTVTLPRVVGAQRAALLFYTGRRIGGEEACDIGLVDLLAPPAQLRAAALELAREIAGSAPIAVVATRRTLRRGLADSVAAAVDHELAEQERHFRTDDFHEGVRAMEQRRAPLFAGR